MVVISLTFANYDVHYILVDNESLVDILFYNTFHIMNLSINQLEKLDSPLVGFTKDSVLIEGSILLPVTIKQEPR